MRTAASRIKPSLLAACILLLSALSAAAWADEHPGQVRLWDTMTPLRARPDIHQSTAWRVVTPAAAGRLEGDLVVEMGGLLAAFDSQLGKVEFGSAEAPRIAIGPDDIRGRQPVIAATRFAEQDGVVMVEATFRGAGTGDLPLTFTFKGDGVVSVRSEGKTRGVLVAAPIEVALVPSFVGDDLIYDPKDYPAATTLALPSEHFLLGLLEEENGMLVATWQEEMPSVRLELTQVEPKRFWAASFVGGKGVSLSVLTAPGIWHREVLKPAMLERDVAIGWKPPFPAMWLTQLYEDELKTTFEFRQEKEEHWRGGIGSYTLPAWFSDDRAMLSLGKQIPPEGEAIIYFLERSDETPEGIVSPLDIARDTLAGDARVGVLDVEGRPTWWPMRPDAALGGETCNVTDVLKQIFDAGEEIEKQPFVRGGAEDMVFHLQVMFERNGRYYPFATDMVAYLDAQAKTQPDLGRYLREMRGIAEQMIATYDSTRDSLRDMDYARELEAKTTALAAEKRPDNHQRMDDLKQEWIGMGGAAEELSRREHTLARKLYQQAAYRAATDPGAVPVAEEIRRRTKQCLQRPDSYEIWENY